MRNSLTLTDDIIEHETRIIVMTHDMSPDGQVMQQQVLSWQLHDVVVYGQSCLFKY